MHRALAVASLTGAAVLAVAGVAGSAPSTRDTVPPSSPTGIRLLSATQSSVTVSWQNSTDNVRVTGYEVSGEVATTRVRDPRFVGERLPCGESVGLVVVALDRAGNRSAPAHALVATAPCRDVTAPSAPTGFRQSATTQSAVVLAWDPAVDDTGVVSYGVYQGAVLVSSTSEPATTISNLTCGSTLAVAVDAVDAAGNRSARSSTWIQTSACSSPTPPTPPSGDTISPTRPASLDVTARSATSVTLAWPAASDNVGVAGYGVYEGTAQIAVTAQTSAVVGDLACDTQYTLAVDAYDAAGNRSDRVSVSTSTAACSGSPDTSWRLCSDEYHRCSFTGTKEVRYGKNATWTAPRQFTDGVLCSNDVFGDPLPGVVKVCEVRDLATGDPTDSWTLCAREAENCSFAGTQEVRYGKEPTWTTPRQFTDGVSCSNAVFGDPLPGTTKECQSRRVSDGTGTAKPRDTIAPTQPVGLAIARAEETSITLSWTASSDNVQVIGYGVYRDDALVTSVTQTGATVSGLACGRSYTLAVDAYDAAGNRSSKTSLTGTTAPCTDSQPPSAPTGVHATSRTTTSIALGWTASTDNVGVVGYGLYRGGTLVGSSATTTGIFTGLTCNTTYTLAIDAFDGAGNRSARTTVGVATTACADTTPPSAPTALQVGQASQTSLTLTWEAATDNVGVAGYDAYLQGVKAGTSTSTSYTLSGLTCGTPYTVGVLAFDAAGNRSSQITAVGSTSSCSSTAEWRLCSDEYVRCSFAGTKEVRFGKGTTWTTPRQFTDGVQCTIDVFGDPIPGTIKECQVRDSGTVPPPAPPSGTVSYPASYTNGPLGTRNPLPPKKGAFLLAWHGKVGCDWTCTKNGILARQQAMGRKFDGIGNAWVPHERREQWVHDQGALPIIAGWSPGGSAQQIAAGQRDAQIIELANYVKSFDFTVMVRMFHEFDMEHLTYHACGQAFIDMWRHVVDVMRQQGVTNLGYWWSPNEGYNRSCVASSYPGDAYVDWVGTDSYNWQYVGESGWVTPLHSGWGEFWELFDYPNDANGNIGLRSQHTSFGPSKPFVVGETGTVYDSNHPSKKGDWFRNIVAAAQQMEYLTGIMFFDQDVSAVEGPRANWLVDHPTSNPDVLAGFVQLARDPYFNTR